VNAPLSIIQTAMTARAASKARFRNKLRRPVIKSPPDEESSKCIGCYAVAAMLRWRGGRVNDMCASGIWLTVSYGEPEGVAATSGRRGADRVDRHGGLQ